MYGLKKTFNSLVSQLYFFLFLQYKKSIINCTNQFFFTPGMLQQVYLQL